MKYKIMMIIALALTLTARSAFGQVIGEFPGWDKVIEESSNIVIVYAQDPTPSGTVPFIANMPDWQGKILSVLKGTNITGAIRFLTWHELKEHSLYLVFGYYDSIGLTAVENFRVVPLYNGFPLDSLKGKTLDEQLQLLFKDGLEQSNQKIQEDEEERDRLEQGIRK